jgi:hypothetical protein
VNLSFLWFPENLPRAENATEFTPPAVRLLKDAWFKFNPVIPVYSQVFGAGSWLKARKGDKTITKSRYFFIFLNIWSIIIKFQFRM